MKRRRLLVAFLVAAVGLVSLGARCIENTHVRKDPDGYYHVTGEMYNDTDISATSVTLQGSLLDVSGNVIAETTGPLCPVTVQPQSKNSFDLRFPAQNLPNPAGYRVRPISGTTIEGRLPASSIRIIGFDARRFANVAIRGDIENQSTATYSNMSICVAFYNPSGQVVHVFSSPIDGPVAPGGEHHFGFTDTGPVPAEADRAVLWFVAAPGLEWVSSDVSIFLTDQ